MSFAAAAFLFHGLPVRLPGFGTPLFLLFAKHRRSSVVPIGIAERAAFSCLFLAVLLPFQSLWKEAVCKQLPECGPGIGIRDFVCLPLGLLDTLPKLREHLPGILDEIFPF